MCINYLVQLHNMFWVFAVAGLQTLISVVVEAHSSDIEWRGLLRIAHVERDMIEREEFSTIGLEGITWLSKKFSTVFTHFWSFVGIGCLKRQSKSRSLSQQPPLDNRLTISTNFNFTVREKIKNETDLALMSRSSIYPRILRHKSCLIIRRDF